MMGLLVSHQAMCSRPFGQNTAAGRYPCARLQHGCPVPLWGPAGLSFREEQWLHTRPLSVATVMDYFRLSPWYDPGSINARAIEQGLAPEAARCAHWHI